MDDDRVDAVISHLEGMNTTLKSLRSEGGDLEPYLGSDEVCSLLSTPALYYVCSLYLCGPCDILLAAITITASLQRIWFPILSMTPSMMGTLVLLL